MTITIYTGLYSHFHDESTMQTLSKRLKSQLYPSLSSSSSSPPPTLTSSNYNFEYIPMDVKNQVKFMKDHGHECYQVRDYDDQGIVFQTYQEFLSTEHTKPLAQELWKYCALAYNKGDTDNTYNMVGYIDLDTPLLEDLDVILNEYLTKQTSNTSDSKEDGKLSHNFAVLGDALSPSLANKYNNDREHKHHRIHGSLLLLQLQQEYLSIIHEMIHIIISSFNTDKKVIYDPLYISQQLYNLIVASRDNNDYKLNNNWILFQQRCHSNPFETQIQQRRKLLNSSLAPSLSTSNNIQTVINCPSNQIYCCDIITPVTGKAIMMTRHIILPYQLIPQSITKDEDYDHNNEMAKNNNYYALIQQYDKPFITTIKNQKIHEQQNQVLIQKPKNFFQLLQEQNCLPTSKQCGKCMSRSEFYAGTCIGCAKYCGCFCDLLCHVQVEEKTVINVYTSILPRYKKDPTKRIPRIIHQTWFEDITREA